MHTKLTPEELSELFAFKEPSIAQLSFLAHKCGKKVKITANNELVLYKEDNTLWNPIYNPAQTFELLAALIAIGDCKLFYDDGAGDYFIYKFNAVAYDTNLGNFPKLNETVIAAAVALWCPED